MSEISKYEQQKKKQQGICIWLDGDGKAHAYNNEFDVTIHCENEREMNEAIALLHLANRLHWRKTEEVLPTEKDADENGKVLAVAKHGALGSVVETWWFDGVARHPNEFPVWMPLPELPEDD